MSLVFQEKNFSSLFAGWTFTKFLVGFLFLSILLFWFFSIPDNDAAYRPSDQGTAAEWHKKVSQVP